MTISRLDKASWQTYFDKFSRLLSGEIAEIEVDSLPLGQQFEAKFVPLLGIVYDPKSDLVEVLLEGLDHTIPKPKEIYVDHDGVQVSSVEVIDGDDVRQIIKLRTPLMLPAPPGA